ncbi:MAG: alcohol dehydrogenase, class IV, partial [Halorubrum sp. J07HR59]
MIPISDAFTHDHHGCDIVYGRGCVDDLGEYLAERDLSDALIVCGSNVGANDDLMDPIRAGLEDRLTATYDGTTPAKQVESAFQVRDRIAETDADVVVGIGGGSSLDVARIATVFAGDDRSLSELRSEAEQEGEIAPPTASADQPDVIVIPTTFAGADISDGGSVTVLTAEESPTGQPVTSGGSASLIADFADPALFETTPTAALAG